MRPCHNDHPADPASCRLCWLYEHDPAYRALWDGNRSSAIVPGLRSLPCIHLGAVLDRAGCPCPARWLRRCGVHGSCTIEVCKSCPDYEAAD
jgi:hypothetical protein